MAEQQRVNYVRPKEESKQYTYDAKDAVREQEEARKAQLAQQAGKTAVEASDVILDEIDAILEDNALEFVNTFVQKGGE